MSPELPSNPVKINLGWCKACGLCIEVCPKNVLSADKRGRAIVSFPDDFLKCRLCEMSCPDFAIVVDSSGECEV